MTAASIKEINWDSNKLISTETISDGVIREKRMCERKGKNWLLVLTLKNNQGTWGVCGFVAYSRRSSAVS